MNYFKTIINGIVKENPTFVLLLGMCPTLATTTSAINGLGMGVATMFVLICSNTFISLLKNLIPDGVRIPCYIVVIASFVTLLQMLMQAYVPDLYKTLGIFIPLIVVNCIILGRAEAFAAKNNVLASVCDGIGIGIGFTLALTILGFVRELLGNGAVFGYQDQVQVRTSSVVVPQFAHIRRKIGMPDGPFVKMVDDQRDGTFVRAVKEEGQQQVESQHLGRDVEVQPLPYLPDVIFQQERLHFAAQPEVQERLAGKCLGDQRCLARTMPAGQHRHSAALLPGQP